MELINSFAPPLFEFWREPSNPEQARKAKQAQQAPRGWGMSAADVMAAASAAAAKPVEVTVPFHGSLSTMEIAQVITEHLAVNEEAARVVVTGRDVSWLSGTEANEDTRVGALGDYEVEIKVQGADQAIRRKVRIHSTIALE